MGQGLEINSAVIKRKKLTLAGMALAVGEV